MPQASPDDSTIPCEDALICRSAVEEAHRTIGRGEFVLVVAPLISAVAPVVVWFRDELHCPVLRGFEMPWSAEEALATDAGQILTSTDITPAAFYDWMDHLGLSAGQVDRIRARVGTSIGCTGSIWAQPPVFGLIEECANLGEYPTDPGPGTSR